MESKKQRLGHISKQQKEALIDFLEANPELVKQKLNNSLTYKQAAKLWEDVAKTFNSIPGAFKPWQSWRKCWQDMKTDVKFKLSAIKKYAGGTGGGGQSKIILTDIETRVSYLIDDITVSGHKDVAESAVDMELPQNETISPNICYDKGITRFINVPANSTKIMAPCTVQTNDLDNMPSTSTYTNINILPSNAYSVVNLTSSEISCNDFTDISPQNNESTTQDERTNVQLEAYVLESSCNAPHKKKRKRNVASQRLTQTINTADAVTKSIREKNLIKENYYAKKLEVLQKLVQTKEQSSAAKVRIANSMEKIAESLNK